MFLATGGAESFSEDGGIGAAYATAEFLVRFACLGASATPVCFQFVIFGGTFQAFSVGKAFLSVLLCTGGAAKLSGYRWFRAAPVFALALRPFPVQDVVGVMVDAVVPASSWTVLRSGS